MSLKAIILLMVVAAATAASVRPAVDVEALLSLPREEAVARLKVLLRPALERAVAAAEVSVERPAERGVIDDQIIAVLEKLRTLMQEGNEEMGIPVLDPFHLSHLDVETHQSLIDFVGALDEFVIEGLSDFNIDKIKWSTLLFTLNFGLTFPKVEVRGEYDADGVLAGLLPVYGDGPFTFVVEGFSISGKVKLSIKGLGFQIKSAEVNIDIGSYHSDIDGLLGGGDLSDLINEVINDLVPEIFVARKSLIESLVSEAIVVIGNKVLDSVMYSDLMEYIDNISTP